MNAIILMRTDHIEQHPLRTQEIATPNPGWSPRLELDPRAEYRVRERRRDENTSMAVAD
jgi:hypothetical protein